MRSSENVDKLQCQRCGQHVAEGPNCDGRPFVVGGPQNSIVATGSRKELLDRKGFRQTSNPNGDFYYHPMYGVVCIYPGGGFAIGYRETTLALDAYLDSLSDSSYSELTSVDEPPWQTRCGICGGVGPLFPDEHNPFPHKISCPQART